ncbi:unnamed protein product [Orchesella dallaii]|uniref:Partial AB-hydrolase lipase domain-containing protein n=1 Tax=Orchesella dallaii TaxID=48710 RepID=A0ABP1PWQ5_9HEXA
MMGMLNLAKLAILASILGSSFALTLVPRTTLPENPICIPNTIPPIELPLDYATCAQQVADSKNKTHPDQGKTTDEIARAHGYSVEMYNVTTEDKYILLVHRITGGALSPAAPGKPSVFLHHGMAGSSDNWLFLDGSSNLAFKLADAGYDVWLTNCRGTTYSLGHEKLNSATDVKYWDFSWHELGMYDIPAVMAKIEEVSGNEKMFYVGYSMGTTSYFVAMSERPALNDKLIAAFMLSPCAFDGHATNPIRLISPLLGIGGKYLLDPVLRGRIEQPYELMSLFNVSLSSACTPTAARCGLCDKIFLLFNYDAGQMNYTNLPNILSKTPNIISVKTLVHYSQTIASCGFQQFDYGPVENLVRYGTLLPPAYNLTKITAPTYFFRGDYDNLAVPEVNNKQPYKTPYLNNLLKKFNLITFLDFSRTLKSLKVTCYLRQLCKISEWIGTCLIILIL